MDTLQQKLEIHLFQVLWRAVKSAIGELYLETIHPVTTLVILRWFR